MYTFQVLLGWYVFFHKAFGAMPFPGPSNHQNVSLRTQPKWHSPENRTCRQSVGSGYFSSITRAYSSRRSRSRGEIYFFSHAIQIRRLASLTARRTVSPDFNIKPCSGRKPCPRDCTAIEPVGVNKALNYSQIFGRELLRATTWI